MGDTLPSCERGEWWILLGLLLAAIVVSALVWMSAPAEKASDVTVDYAYVSMP
jgi:hypothetical protein